MFRHTVGNDDGFDFQLGERGAQRVDETGYAFRHSQVDALGAARDWQTCIGNHQRVEVAHATDHARQGLVEQSDLFHSRLSGVD